MNIAVEIGVEKPLDLAYLIEEHVVALFQLKVDEYYCGERRTTTHGYMGNKTFRVAEDVWVRSVEELGESWDLVRYMEEFLSELGRSKDATKELKKLFGEKPGQAKMGVCPSCFFLF